MITLAGLTIVVLLLFYLDYLSIYPDRQATQVMIKDLSLRFWKEIGHLDTRYHVILPFEGLIVIAFIYLYFCIGLTRIHQSKKRLSD